MCSCRTVCMFRITEWRCPIPGELLPGAAGPGWDGVRVHFAELRARHIERERADRIGGAT